jgi:DNA-binding GntR family transcriptional regulator
MAEPGATTATVNALNRQFHQTLLDAAKNRFLVRAMGSWSRTLLILGETTLADPRRASEAISEHDRILAALKDRDTETAEREMRAHVKAAHRMRLRALRARDREADGA